MRKHIFKRSSAILSISAALVAGIVLAGCSSDTDGQKWIPDGGGESGTPGGNTIVIEEWGVSFSLPNSIDQADVTLRPVQAEPGENEWVGVASEALADKLRRDLCWGTELEAGEFLSIHRLDQPKDDTVQVGDHHYRVVGGMGDEQCYDGEIAASYLAEDVQETAKQTLTERR